MHLFLRVQKMIQAAGNGSDFILAAQRQAFLRTFDVPADKSFHLAQWADDMEIAETDQQKQQGHKNCA